MLHHPAKQRQPRAPKAVFHLKTGSFVQANTQQTIPTTHAGGAQRTALGDRGSRYRPRGAIQPNSRRPGRQGPVAIVSILAYRLGKIEVVKTYATSFPPCAVRDRSGVPPRQRSQTSSASIGCPTRCCACITT